MTSTRACLLAASCIVALAGAASGQMIQLNQPQAPAVDLGPKPTLIFDRAEHNFGTIFDNQRVVTRLEFWNEGPGVLEIRSWRGSCSCTVSELHREGEDPNAPAGGKQPDGTLPIVVFQPGQRGWLDVTFDPHGKHGVQSQTVTFEINDPSAPARVFKIIANVLPLVSIEPQVVNFGSVSRRQSAVLDVFVTGRTEDFEVEAATISGLDFATVEIHETVELVRNEEGAWVIEEDSESDADAPEGDATATRKAGGEDADPSSPAQPGETPASEADAQPIVREGADQDTRLRRTRLSVHLSPEAPPGRFSGTLTVRHNDARREAVTAIVMGEVIGDVAVMPRQLAVGIQLPNQQFERKLQVLARGSAGFRITQIEQVSNLPDSHKFNIQWEPITSGPNQGYIVTVRGRFPPTLAQVQGEFRIHTTLESDPVITVPFFGHVQGAR